MQLESLLEKLKMDHLSARLETVCEQASKRELDYKGFLTEALNAEWNGRHGRGVEMRLSQAHFPVVKTLEQFDFGFQPSLDRKVLRELSGMGFVERSENVVFLGPPGVGKSHLAIALGVKAVEAGYRVLFLTLEELLTRLRRAQSENRLERMLQQLVYPRLLILDEIGYLPMSREEASLFFRLLCRRYEKASLILTSNKSFLDWGDIFGTRSWPPPSWTASCTMRRPSISRGSRTGSRKNGGRGSWSPRRFLQRNRKPLRFRREGRNENRGREQSRRRKCQKRPGLKNRTIFR
ncbi:MAG: Putative IstB-like ATP-binding protein [Leptospirillum sp. Group II 'C75']|jgi:DNA replication protein DnaC|uniref:Putative IstB-like ATP-binding protein n=1 Tax=Leptospirillum sp. Group II '5-way CG' TaxID=419541 RepID=B6AS00_9BACT|nr:MAG: putative IstB-like ATP-binding protein [Leptospirillum rubarum]EDZ38251.1 MAG: Putative IstB-like ATP-binding protein [Leptospirillum sp. Group II '5-way CG']EIJ75551.1 MAG: Putative IstB-like ATP-binding protein [Leptospirillum sp. Group II 'C75']